MLIRKDQGWADLMGAATVGIVKRAARRVVLRDTPLDERWVSLKVKVMTLDSAAGRGCRSRPADTGSHILRGEVCGSW